MIILFVVLTQCVGGGQGGLPAGDDSARHVAVGRRQRPLRQVRDRRRRQRGRRLRPRRRRELAHRLLGRRRCRSSPARSSRPSEVMRPSPARSTPGAARRPRDGRARSTARSTRGSTSTRRSSRRCSQGQLGGPAGDFVEPYVLAHEYGHHIQNLLGTMGQVRTQQGPKSDARTARAAGRLLRRHVDRQRDRHRRRGRRAAHPRADPGGHRRGARRGQGGRRRPDPGPDDRPGQPARVDARLGGAADALVHDRLRPGRRCEACDTFSASQL